jgi:hypothetical protein
MAQDDVLAVMEPGKMYTTREIQELLSDFSPSTVANNVHAAARSLKICEVGSKRSPINGRLVPAYGLSPHLAGEKDKTLESQG